MPQRLVISAKDRARRHVLGQRLYRLRLRYRYLRRSGLKLNARHVMGKIRVLSTEYDGLGGQPRHKGNIL